VVGKNQLLDVDAVLVWTLCYLLRGRHVFLVIYVTRLDMQLMLMMASHYLKTPPNLAVWGIAMFQTLP
jgi:hypothetical protein